MAAGGYLLWRRRQAAAAETPSSSSGTGLAAGAPGGGGGASYYSASPGSSYYSSTPTSAFSDYGAPAPVSVLPPLTIPVDTGTGQPNVTVPNPTPTGPPQNSPVNTPPTPPPPPPPAPSPASPAPVAPAPPWSPANIPADLLRAINGGGETIIKAIEDPLTGGTWYLGSKGGIFALGGARFLGSARNYGFDDPNVRKAVDIQPNGNGYRVISSRGETYNFPG